MIRCVVLDSLGKQALEEEWSLESSGMCDGLSCLVQVLSLELEHIGRNLNLGSGSRIGFRGRGQRRGSGGCRCWGCRCWLA